jgi:intein/homing endonuclease
MNKEKISQLIKAELYGLNASVFDQKFDNPLEPRTQLDIEQPHIHILRILRKPENFYFTAKHIFNIELAPFQLVILNELWYRKYPMLIATRGGSKSYLLALYAMMRALFNQGSKIVVVGAAFRQAKVVFEYCEHIWYDAPILRDIVGNNTRSGPRRDIDRCTCTLGDSVIICLPTGDGCLSPYTAITYDNRFGKIKEEKVENKYIKQRQVGVWGNGQFNLSDEFYCNGNTLTKKVKLASGISIEGTYNHKLKILKDDNIVWARLDELKIGDRLLVDRSYRWHNGQANVTIEQAYALGLMIGDGCWTQKRRLGFATKDQELIDNLRKGTGYSFKQASDQVHFWQEGIKYREDWLDFWNLQTCYTIDKYLPEKILSVKREVMSACISGLFDTDGHVQVVTAKGGTGILVGFTNTSERLVDQLQYILLHYGIISTKTSRKRKENNNWNIVYELSITGKDVKLFAEQINFRLSRKRLILEAAIVSKKKWSTNSDDIPYVKDEMIQISNENRIPKGERDKLLDSISASNLQRKNIITRDLVYKFIQKYSFTNDPFLAKLKELANPDIYYDTITSIEDSECVTYDIHIPNTHEYCANGFFSHNTKIRGQRANVIIADEFSTIPKAIYEEVISGFGAVSSSPIEAMKHAARIRVLKKMDKWTPEMQDKEIATNIGNQAILAGTANYSFNHFADYWKEYKGIINSKGDPQKLLEVFKGKIPPKFNWKNYSVMRIPVELLPEDFMDEEHVARAKVTTDSGTYAVEYGAVFAGDSNGFYKKSLIESCVVRSDNLHLMLKNVELFQPRLRGDRYLKYIFAVDTASEHDNFAITILELHSNHTRVVYCWTTTRAKHLERIKHGTVKEKNFYAYCARKIRELMKVFNCIRINMDAQGGGRAVLEALHDMDKLELGEQPIWEVIDPEDEKETDNNAGLHIVEMIEFANAAWVSEANHGMKKDFEDKVLLFPYFDPIKLYEANLDDKKFGRIIINSKGEEVQLQDTFEDLVMEIEELKNELSTITHTQTPKTNREHWDTPEIIQSNNRRGRLRKDRYTSLLMANMAARTMIRAPMPIQYKATGGFAKDIVKEQTDNLRDMPLYEAPEWFTIPQTSQGYGMVVRRQRD